MPPLHFVVFIAVSLAVFFAILCWVFRARPSPLPWARIWVVAFLVVVVGMCFAKFGANAGLPVYVYYGIPAVLALVVPPAVFRMQRNEIIQYLLLTFASSPIIHVAFSFFIGWHEYLPFWQVPSVWD